jgi:hypothetical protein
MKTMLSVIAFASLAAGAVLAGEPNGVQRWEQQFDFFGAEAIPVPCLGTSLEGTEFATFWVREFYTPVTGTYHFIGHNLSEVHLYDQAGNTWLGKGEGSFEINASRGETLQYVARYLFKPVGDNKGPMWTLTNKGHITLNANGDVVVDRPGGSGWEDLSSCLPAKK